MKMNESRELKANIDRIHTTDLGAERIKRNLSLDTDHPAEWCKSKIISPDAVITRNGKNWYVKADGCIITINAHSYTIITAHMEKIKRLTCSLSEQYLKREESFLHMNYNDVVKREVRNHGME